MYSIDARVYIDSRDEGVRTAFWAGGRNEGLDISHKYLASRTISKLILKTRFSDSKTGFGFVSLVFIDEFFFLLQIGFFRK